MERGIMSKNNYQNWIENKLKRELTCEREMIEMGKRLKESNK